MVAQPHWQPEHRLSLGADLSKELSTAVQPHRQLVHGQHKRKKLRETEPW